MSHAANMNASWHTYKWVMSHIWMCHVTRMNEPCHTYEWVMLPIYGAGSAASSTIYFLLLKEPYVWDMSSIFCQNTNEPHILWKRYASWQDYRTCSLQKALYLSNELYILSTHKRIPYFTMKISSWQHYWRRLQDCLLRKNEGKSRHF